jgi:predicted glycosyltransferase
MPRLPHIFFYISGHGFGHARRSCQIIAALIRRDSSIRITVRSDAPRQIFQAIGLDDRQIQNSSLDAAIVEKDAFTIDDEATATHAIEFCRSGRAIVAGEVEAVRLLSPDLIVCDIPFLAGEVAAKLQIPCVASGNFTWDWIFEPMLRDKPDGAETLQKMTAGYARMTTILRHPFSHAMPQFPQVWDIPAVAHPVRDREIILSQLNFDSAESRLRILLAMRGGVAGPTLLAGVKNCPDFVFTMLGSPSEPMPANLRAIQPIGVDFAEVMAVHDVTISKLGSGLVCDALAAKARLLWPRRTGFREDELFDPAASKFLNLQEIPREDYISGRWQGWIERLLAQPSPRFSAPVDGADKAAERLCELLR